MFSKSLLKSAIRWSKRSSTFGPRGAYSYKLTPTKSSAFPQAETEYADLAGFVENFQRSSHNFLKSISGKRLLDFGSGYGGRTVRYAESASEVFGIEIFPNVVEKSQQFAASKGIENCYFSLGTQGQISFPNDFFDVVISNDVLEHVEHPDTVIHEFYRVLRPDGLAFIAFTPYWGMFAHHLNYITMLPAIHWLWSPKVAIEAVNDLLKSDPAYVDLISLQPAPKPAFDGTKEVLPTLNGLTLPLFRRLYEACGFRAEFFRSTPILEKFPALGKAGAILNEALCRIPSLEEALSANLVVILRK